MIDETEVRAIQERCEKQGDGMKTVAFRAQASILSIAMVTAASESPLGAQEAHCLPDLCIRSCTIPSLSDTSMGSSPARTFLLTHPGDSLFSKCQLPDVNSNKLYFLFLSLIYFNILPDPFSPFRVL